MQNTEFDVIIIGGSYAGLSAAMGLGRSLRKVLIIDAGDPCNRQTPFSHNFITHDGTKPSEITKSAREQVLKYETVVFHAGFADFAEKTATGFVVSTSSGGRFSAKILLFATGIKDQLLPISGFKECWGISIIHCPYCHGYEVRHQKTGILANGDIAFETARLISNWTNDLTIYTNGPSTLKPEDRIHLNAKNIPVVELPIERFEHEQGQLKQIVFSDETTATPKTLYARVGFKQHSDLPEKLGCSLTDHGFLEINEWQETTVKGVFACGDNSSPKRSVANAVSGGNFTAAVINKQLIESDF